MVNKTDNTASTLTFASQALTWDEQSESPIWGFCSCNNEKDIAITTEAIDQCLAEQDMSFTFPHFESHT